jgi:hypothetical protein
MVSAILTILTILSFRGLVERVHANERSVLPARRRLPPESRHGHRRRRVPLLASENGLTAIDLHGLLARA